MKSDRPSRASLSADGASDSKSALEVATLANGRLA